MMKLKNLVENFGLARLALQHYPHDADTLDSILPRFRISSNAVYPYFNQGQLRFLRLAPLEEKHPDHVQVEIDFIQHLRRHDYPAMEPVPAKDNRLSFVLSSPWGEYCVSSFAAVHGTPIEDTHLTPEIVHAYGRSLGQLHALSSGYVTSPARPAWYEALNRNTLQAVGASPALLLACDRLFAELASLPADESCFGLIHYDFEPDNVFWDSDARAVSVIDFDDCLYGWYAMDVAQAMNELDPQWIDAFLSGYRSCFPFTAAQEATLPLMQRYILLRGYMRLKHCLSEAIPEPPAWMIDLHRMLTAKVDKLEAMILQ